MSRRTTYTNPRMRLPALAALAVAIGAVLISAAPARADHDGFRAGVHFFFSLPLPPIPVAVYAPPPVYYAPAPPVYYAPPVYSYDKPCRHGHRRHHHHWRGRGARHDDWDEDWDDD